MNAHRNAIELVKEIMCRDIDQSDIEVTAGTLKVRGGKFWVRRVLTNFMLAEKGVYQERANRLIYSVWGAILGMGEVGEGQQVRAGEGQTG